MEIVTYEVMCDVLKKLLKKRGMSEKDINELAYYVVNFFGYNDCVVDNTLTPADRYVFNTLEELGIVRTVVDEITISRSKLWRIHYWLYRMDTIEKIFNQEDVEEEENPEDVYKRIFNEE
ncbi:MAG: hypothetical protein GXO25_05715 [Euryarchaeota archaeon]|nr:hypothetical protein [Euryarchaeota archaeon]